jgi:hypothetical protein
VVRAVERGVTPRSGPLFLSLSEVIRVAVADYLKRKRALPK